MKELVNIHGHTIDKTLMTQSGVIIDVGCRDFLFAISMGGKVYCIDPDPDVFDQRPTEASGFFCINAAVSNKTGDAFFYRNGELTCLTEVYQPLPHLYTPCKTITMEDIYKQSGEEIDILKLDCEGSEYLILGDPNFRPIPKQITVEFHNHFIPEVHKANIGNVMDNLLKHYTLMYQHENGMDNLFIRK